MNTVFSTTGVHPHEAFDYWHEELCRKVIRHDCYPEDRSTFQAQLQSTSLAGAGLFYFASTPIQYDVADRHAAQTNADELFFRLQIAGRYETEQEGHEAAFEAGDMTLIDPRRPWRGNYSNGPKQMLLKVPRRQLEARVGGVRALSLYPIKPSQPESALTAAYLTSLLSHADALDAASGDIVKNQVLDLIALSIAKITGRESPRISSARSIVLLSVRAAVEARLTDPVLDAATVAAAAGVSVRYANAVLADEGMSITHLIWSRRLERCRRALRDASQAQRTISEIAYGWGFSDMTHFARRFKEAYGSLPSEYRRHSKP